ncbi:phosphodiester glycosidase family protein [Massilia eurypsychrophila]|uniref:phosphodiester glycosidase family protein n=1 Tax=Massilia eurypsychrophila TaxID=1485217 RepID=UPI001034D65B|nr:phosphodiester glycosidase family protein [Massilia eurypsychrophila]
MKISILPLLFLLLISPVHGAQRLPSYPEPVQAYTAGMNLPENVARLKISVFSESSIGEKNVRLGSLVVCSAIACYRPETPTYFNLQDTSGKTNKPIADFQIPVSTINEIYFTDVNGGAVVTGSIKLEPALKLEKGFHGAEVMLILSKQGIGNQTKFQPARSSSVMIAKTSTSVYYSPYSEAVVTLPLGVTLTIPKDALSAPQIFSVNVHDTGDKFPMVDIYPYVTLKKPAILESQIIIRALEPASKVGRTPSPSPSGVSTNSIKSNAITRDAPQSFRKTIFKTGVIKSSSSFDGGSAGIAASSTSALATTSTSSCASILGDPLNQTIINNALTQGNGVVYINWCENIPPYAHIAITNLNDSRIRYSIPTVLDPAPSPWIQDYVMLKQITEGAGYSIVKVNGTVWTGDEGTSANQHGRINGFFISTQSYSLGSNVAGGGNGQGHPTYDGPKFAMTITYSGPPYGINFGMGYQSLPPPYIGDYANMISSSTSVVKDGVCATAGTENRWSAVGASGGRMMMISSTSDGTTSAAELCPLFLTMQMPNALRLDGGPSTAMVIDNALKNPNTGLAYFKYGNMRRIAFPLRISY